MTIEEIKNIIAEVFLEDSNFEESEISLNEENIGEEYLREITKNSERDIKLLQSILLQAKKLRVAIFRVPNMEANSENIKTLDTIITKTNIIKTRVRISVVIMQRKLSKPLEPNIKNATKKDIIKLTKVYRDYIEVTKILSEIKRHLKTKTRERENKEVKDQFEKEKFYNPSVAKKIFSLIEEFLYTKLKGPKNDAYIQFYRLFIVKGKSLDELSKIMGKNINNLYTIKSRLEIFLNQLIKKGELQKFIKDKTEWDVRFRNNELKLYIKGNRHYDKILNGDITIIPAKENKKIQQFAGTGISETIKGVFNEENLDEERLANSDIRPYVERKENFLGTHIFGEKIGEGENSGYVVCSYIKGNPIFIYYEKLDKWFKNSDQFRDPESGEIIDQTDEHKELAQPNVKMNSRTTNQMLNILHNIMKKNGVANLEHSDVPPGEK